MNKTRIEKAISALQQFVSRLDERRKILERIQEANKNPQKAIKCGKGQFMKHTTLQIDLKQNGYSYWDSIWYEALIEGSSAVCPQMEVIAPTKETLFPELKKLASAYIDKIDANLGLIPANAQEHVLKPKTGDTLFTYLEKLENVIRSKSTSSYLKRQIKTLVHHLKPLVSTLTSQFIAELFPRKIKKSRKRPQILLRQVEEAAYPIDFILAGKILEFLTTNVIQKKRNAETSLGALTLCQVLLFRALNCLVPGNCYCMLRVWLPALIQRSQASQNRIPTHYFAVQALQQMPLT